MSPGPDVVEHGAETGGPARLPPWLTRLGLGTALVLTVVGLTRSGLLSADAPTPAPGPTASGSGVAERPPVAVARSGDLLLLGVRRSSRVGATLPRGLAAGAPLVAVRPGTGFPPVPSDGRGTIVGVHHGLLFRADPDGQTWRSLGPGAAVVDASAVPDRALVERGGRLVEVEVRSGGTTDHAPFPGSTRSKWSPQGLFAAAGSGALLMSAPAGPGMTRLGLAWPTGLVRTGARPPLQDLGVYGPLVGIADDWALTLRGPCPGAACRLRVVSVTQDLVLAHDVAPPQGWTFLAGPSAGRTHEALVLVEHLTGGRPDGLRALARLVPGGDNALLVRGTDRVVPEAGLVDGPGGSVYLLADPGSNGLVALSWDPAAPASARPAPGQPVFPRGSRLVCVCG